MDITNVVMLLVDTAKQLHAAKVAAEQCSSDAESLIECVRDNTLLIQAAVQEGLHASSSNATIATLLCNAIGKVVKTLSMARDAYYNYLLAGKMYRSTKVHTIKGTLKDVRTTLDNDLKHLHRCMSVEIWRVVKGGQTASVSCASNNTHELPEQTAKQLAELQLLPNTSASPPKEVAKQMRKMVKRTARLVLGTKEKQEAAVVELVEFSEKGPMKDVLAAAGAIPPLVHLLNKVDTKVQADIVSVLYNLAEEPGIRPRIVSAGGIPALLKAAGHCSSDRDKHLACHALAYLASHRNPDYRPLIVAAGGIPTLVGLLGSDNAEVHGPASWALAGLSYINDTAAREGIAAAGAIPPLVRLLYSSDVDLQRCVAEALANLAREPGIRPRLVSAGAIPALVRAAGSSMQVQREACFALGRLALHNDPDYKPAILDAGGIPRIVELLHSDNINVHRAAAFALVKVACGGTLERAAIAAAGAIPPLVQLLDSPIIPMQVDAALALSNLAEEPCIRPKIVSTKAIPAILIAVLNAAGSTTEQVQKKAACVLANLASHGNPGYAPEIVDAGGAQALVTLLGGNNAEVHAPAVKALRYLSRCRTERAAIAAAGAIPPLAGLLDSGDMGIQQHAAVALANLAMEPGNRPRFASAIPALLKLAGNTGDWNKKRLVACALGQLASHSDPDLKPAIVAAGGIPSLVGLVGSSNAEVHKPAAEALRHLSTCTTELAAIGAADSIPPLVRLLGSSDVEVQQHAAVALANLALEPGNRAWLASAGAIPAFLSLAGNAEEWGQRLAACALGQLASHSDPDYRPAIVAAGGIPSLVGLLGSSNAEVHRPAVMTLRHLSTCTTELAAVGSAGAIPSLVRLLGSSDVEVQQHAAVALANLALEPRNRPQIVCEGGIRAFLSLAGNGEAWGQRQACFAVANLASNINPDYKLAIVAAGGTPILVGLLHNDNAKVYGPAAEALLQLSKGGEIEQEALLVGGAIPRLVQLLDSGSALSQISDSDSPPVALSALLNLAQGSKCSAVAIKAADAASIVQRLLSEAGSVVLREAASELLGCLS